MQSKSLIFQSFFRIHFSGIIALALYLLFSVVVLVLDWGGELFYANRLAVSLLLGPIPGLSQLAWILREFSLVIAFEAW